jgi:outer membrane protein TolC
VLLARGKVSKHEYEQTRTLADEARAALNVARQALEQHKQSHGC